MAEPTRKGELLDDVREHAADADANLAAAFEDPGLIDDSGVENDDDPEDAARLPPRFSGRVASQKRVRSASGVQPSRAHWPLSRHEYIRAGDVLDEKYLVERIIGRRGFEVVLEAQHLELEQPVTLRYLLPDAWNRKDAVANFIRQGRAAGQIHSEHAARVLDVGRLESGAPFLVMESLRGWNLEEVLRVRGPLPRADAVEYIVQACEAVAEAHALGIVHGGLGTPTLVLTRRSDGSPVIKVLEFGAPDLLDSGFLIDPVPGAGPNAHASLRFSSPEQIRRVDEIDARADVWALGATLYELLTGMAAFEGAGASGLLASIAADSPKAVRSFAPDVPPELEGVILRCLAKERSRRFANVADFVLALKPFASAEAARAIGRISRVLGRATEPPPLPGTAAIVRVSNPVTSAPVIKSPLWFAVAAVIGGLVGAFFGVTAGRDVKPEAPAAVLAADAPKPLVEPSKPLPAAADTAEAARTTPAANTTSRVAVSPSAGSVPRIARQTTPTAERPSTAPETVAEPARSPSNAPPTANSNPATPQNRSATDSPGSGAPKPVAASNESQTGAPKSATGTDLFDDTR